MKILPLRAPRSVVAVGEGSATAGAKLLDFESAKPAPLESGAKLTGVVPTKRFKK
ncbi:MAG TPA: hypothetical protein VHM93_00355 [Candidatus Acidoferrum sp.]|jgi:hypothetical protein|nr:hypothetical protein [Candidatus Acidoferrum sp.]